MAAEGIAQRFKDLQTEGGTIGAEVVRIARQAAEDISALFEDISHPSHGWLLQQLERIAHFGASNPAMSSPAADPTQAGQSPAPSSPTPDQSAASSPTPTSGQQSATSPSTSAGE